MPDDQLPAWLWGVGNFIAGGVTLAVIRAAVSRFSERARPELRISSVVVAPTPESEESVAPVDHTIRMNIDSSPILPDPPEGRLTVRQLREYVDSAESILQTHTEVLQHVETLSQRPAILEPNVSKDEQRRLLLQEWMEFGHPLEALARSAIQHFSGELPEKYKAPHPAEWQHPSKARIPLSANQFYDLHEIDVDTEVQAEVAVQGPVGVADRLRRNLETLNILRRIWIQLDPDDLRWLFNRVHTIGEALRNEATSILQQLKAVVVGTSADHLRVQVLVSNDGKRAVAIRPNAILKIHGREDQGPALIPLILQARSGTQPADHVVKGGDATSLSFYSVTPIHHLSASNAAGQEVIDGSHLRSLYETNIVSCEVSISLTGFGTTERTFITSRRFEFGAQAQDRERQALQRTT